VFDKKGRCSLSRYRWNPDKKDEEEQPTLFTK